MADLLTAMSHIARSAGEVILEIEGHTTSTSGGYFDIRSSFGRNGAVVGDIIAGKT